MIILNSLPIVTGFGPRKGISREDMRSIKEGSGVINRVTFKTLQHCVVCGKFLPGAPYGIIYIPRGQEESLTAFAHCTECGDKYTVNEMLNAVALSAELTLIIDNLGVMAEMQS